VSLRSSIGWCRLAFGLQRWELLILGGGTLVYLALGWLAIARLDEARAAFPGCFDPAAIPGCTAVALENYNTWQTLADMLAKAAWVLPVLIGLVLGVPIVAREIEQGTGQLVWSLSTSRTRWFVGRVAPVLLAVVIASLLIGFVADRVTQAAFPRDDVAASFLWYGRRGLLVAARALGWFAIGLAVGARLGRSLPGLLVGGVLVIALLIGTSSAISTWQRAVATPLAAGATADWDSALIVDTTARMPDGRLVSLRELGDAQIIISDAEPPASEMPPGYVWAEEVPIQIPGSDYPLWVARESGIFAGLTLLAGVGSLLIVRRRRPA
jgi:ABC-type transport system involved in multi-copper enzyme maturation permease subunit